MPTISSGCTVKPTPELTVSKALSDGSNLNRRISVRGCLKLGEYTVLYKNFEDARWSRVEKGLGLDVAGQSADVARLPADAVVTGILRDSGGTHLEVEKITTLYEKCES